jgi:hypothetical protein
MVEEAMKLKVAIDVVQVIQFQLHMKMVKPHIRVGVLMHISMGVQLAVQILLIIYLSIFFFPRLH